MLYICRHGERQVGFEEKIRGKLTVVCVCSTGKSSGKEVLCYCHVLMCCVLMFSILCGEKLFTMCACGCSKSLFLLAYYSICPVLEASKHGHMLSSEGDRSTRSLVSSLAHRDLGVQRGFFTFSQNQNSSLSQPSARKICFWISERTTVGKTSLTARSGIPNVDCWVIASAKIQQANVNKGIFGWNEPLQVHSYNTCHATCLPLKFSPFPVVSLSGLLLHRMILFQAGLGRWSLDQCLVMWRMHLSFLLFPVVPPPSLAGWDGLIVILLPYLEKYILYVYIGALQISRVCLCILPASSISTVWYSAVLMLAMRVMDVLMCLQWVCPL